MNLVKNVIESFSDIDHYKGRNGGANPIKRAYIQAARNTFDRLITCITMSIRKVIYR